jgi:predicted hydrocarbon binding protein
LCLNLTPEQRLMLDSVPMVLMPRWFFVAIKRQVEELCAPETARQVYYRAGWEGATKWVQAQMDQAGLSGRDVLEQYMNSASLRGWGKLKVTEYDEDAARVVVTLANSAVAEEIGQTDRAVCDHLPGSIAGAFHAILQRAGRPKKLSGRETNCLAKGDDHCRFEVGPTE